MCSSFCHTGAARPPGMFALQTDLLLHLFSQLMKIALSSVSACVFTAPYVFRLSLVLTVQKLFRDHAQIPARFSYSARLTGICIPGKFQIILRPRDTHKEQTPFLFLLLKVLTPERDHPLVDSDNKYCIKFQTLGGMERHQTHPVRLCRPVFLIRF